MNNGDMPASPAHKLLQDRDGDYSLEVEGGLTKREHFAGLALQGLLAGKHRADGCELIKLSIDAADTLLEALEANDENPSNSK